MDIAVLNFLSGSEKDWLILFMLLATYWGSAITISSISALVVIYLYIQKNYRRLSQLFVVLIGTTATTFIIKYIFARERPEGAFYNESSYSFPSGHAALSMALYGFLIYLLIKHPHRHGRIFLITLLSSIIILVGLSRLYLGVHYPSDVIVGYAVGFVWILLSPLISKLKIWHLQGKKHL